MWLLFSLDRRLTHRLQSFQQANFKANFAINNSLLLKYLDPDNLIINVSLILPSKVLFLTAKFLNSMFCYFHRDCFIKLKAAN